ncbi:MAG TPA: hemerythrin domain-containing protein [Steroidobacteraceae bacterium]|nr:hemerythrin domain-containing protein [Steroidobacteraceae bacterium]
MSPRQSKTGSRSASRARGTRAGGKRAASRSGSHSRSSSARQRSAASASRAASGRRGSQKSREVSTRAGRSRARAAAPYALKLLQQDHRAVAQSLEEFESAEREEKQAIARRICRMLTVHSQIEEELLYPAARDVLRAEDAHLVAEARVEHASLKDLIGQIEDREQMDEQYEAKVRVLGEYVKHHVGEEESELFPRLERSSLDLEALGERLEERKRELSGEQAQGVAEGAQPHDGGSEGLQREEEASHESVMPSGRARGGRGHRPTGLHARRAS